MGRIEKSVFLSYRRTNFSWALAIYQDLTQRLRCLLRLQQHPCGRLRDPDPRKCPRSRTFPRGPHALGTRRPPSLGEILLLEAEARHARKEAEREAQRKAEEEAAVAQSSEPVSITIPQVHAVAKMGCPTTCPEPVEGSRRDVEGKASPPRPQKLKPTPSHRRRKHDTRRRNPIRQQPLDHPLQLHNRSSRNLQEESIAASHMVTLLHLRQLFHKLEERMIPRPIAGHAHNRQNRQPQRLAVYLNRVSANNPGILHPPQPLRRSRSRQPNPPPQVGKRSPSILPQRVKQLSAVIIQNLH